MIPSTKIVPQKTRAMRQSDYDRMYDLIAAGTPKEAIVAVYPITLHTLNLRMKKDRPELHKKLKSLPSTKQIDANDANVAAEIIKATGRILRVDLSEIIGHDISALAADVRQQKEAVKKDPLKKLTPVGLPVARGLHALARTAAMIPGMGMEAGGGGGVTINNTNTVNHAGVMRLGGGDIFAEPGEIEDAIIDVGGDVL